MGCTLPNLTNICLHKSNHKKFYLFVEADKDLRVPLLSLLEKRLWIKHIFETQKTFANQTPVNFAPSQCVNVPTGLYTRREFDSDSQKFKARQNKMRKIENMIRSYLKSHCPNCTVGGYYTTGFQKKIDCFNVAGFCAHCKTIFEAIGCYFHFC